MDISFDATAIGLNLALLLAAAQLLRFCGNGRDNLSAGLLAGLVLGGVAAFSQIWSPGAGDAFALTARWPLLVAAGLFFGFAGGLVALGVALAALVISAGPDGLQSPAAQADAAAFAAIALGAAAYRVFARKTRAPSPMDVALAAAAAVAIMLGADLGLNPPAERPDVAGLAPRAAVEFIGLAIGLAIMAMAQGRDAAVRAEMETLRLSKLSVDTGPEAQLWLDAGGRILLANAAASRLLGYTEAELARRHLRDIDLNAGDPMSPTKRLLSTEGRWPKSFDAKLAPKASGGLTVSVQASRAPYGDDDVIFVGLRSAAVAAPTRETAAAPVAQSAPAPEPALDPEAAAKADAPDAPDAIDDLTALPELSALHARGARMFERLSKRRGYEAATIAYIKIVDFRGYVERRGLSMGEALLQGYGRLLRKSLRAGDFAYRAEDDAFALLMPGRSEESFDYLSGRINDVSRNLNESGFPDAEIAFGLSAFRGQEDGGFDAIVADAAAQAEQQLSRSARRA